MNQNSMEIFKSTSVHDLRLSQRRPFMRAGSPRDDRTDEIVLSVPWFISVPTVSTLFFSYKGLYGCILGCRTKEN